MSLRYAVQGGFAGAECGADQRAVRREEGADMTKREAAGEPLEGLRERKRRATRAAIERAAIALVQEHGYDNVTVARICERADISQGTFFNYFPTKDAAIVGIGVYDLDPEAVFAAYDRLSADTMYCATLALFLQVVDSFDWESDIAGQRVDLVSGTPSLMRLFLDNTFGFVSDFREIVASYLRAHPERRACSDDLTADEEANVVVSEALEAAKFALSRMSGRKGASRSSADEAVSVIRRIVG